MAVLNDEFTLGNTPVRITNGITASTLITIINHGPGNIFLLPSTTTTAPSFAGPSVARWVLPPTPAGCVNRTAAEMWPGFSGVTEIFSVGDGNVGRRVSVSHA